MSKESAYDWGLNGFGQENKICACDNNVDLNTEVSYVECNVKCDGGKKECGGSRSYSVYLGE